MGLCRVPYSRKKDTLKEDLADGPRSRDPCLRPAELWAACSRQEMRSKASLSEEPGEQGCGGILASSQQEEHLWRGISWGGSQD